MATNGLMKTAKKTTNEQEGKKMSIKNVVLIAGVHGVNGRAAAEHWTFLPGTRVYGLSRRAVAGGRGSHQRGPARPGRSPTKVRTDQGDHPYRIRRLYRKTDCERTKRGQCGHPEEPARCR